MNSFKITNHEIEFVFENCETIQISTFAIKNLFFTTKGERFAFDAHHHEMMKSTEMDSFEITLDISDKKCFHHPAQTMLTWGGTDSIITDGERCIERLKTCTDITHMYINGVCYHMPWKCDMTRDKELNIPIYNNGWQENHEIHNSKGEHLLQIKLNMPEGAHESNN